MKRTIFAIMAILSVFAMILAGCDNGGNTGSGKYTVNFEINGGSKIDPIVDVASGTKISKPADPTKTDFTFDGWYKDKEVTSAWNFDSDTVKGNTLLYAKWNQTKPDANPDDETKKNYFTVTFMDGETTVNSYKVSYGEKITAPVVDPVKKDYYFDGWYDGETQTAKKWFFDTRGVTDDVTLYTKYSLITKAPYTVIFSNEGRLHFRIKDVAEGAKIAAPTRAEKEDYVFVAWYKEEELTNRWDFNNDTVTRDITLYAGFTPVIDDPPEDIERAEKVTLTNAWYVVYYFELPPGKTVSDYAELRAYYTLTKTQLKNAVARGARLMGPYPKEFFQMCMGAETGAAPGKGVAVANYNLANAPYILDNTYAWGKEGGAGGTDEGKGTLKEELESALGYAPSPNEWFDLAYAIDGSKKHNDYGKDVTIGPAEGPLFYGLGLPGQAKSGVQEDYSNTFYIRDVKLKKTAGATNTSNDDIVGKPVYFVKDGYKYPAYTGYYNTNGSAGHKEASRESCDELNPPKEINVDW